MTRHNTESDVWRKVDKRGPDECWPCTLRPNTSGYRQLSLRGKMVLAHRLVFFLTRGRWPDPECCHTCDNPACCNPAHLFEGTHSKNMKDMVSKGRNSDIGLKRAWSSPRGGERNSNCKLSDAGVRDIRANYALCRVTQKTLAERYGVSANHVSSIIRGMERAS